MDVTVNKAELLAVIHGNRDRHRGVFDAAVKGYRDTAIRLLDEKLLALKQGRTPPVVINLSRPQDHTADYDRIIKMLEMDTGETFTLEERMFAQYVMDDWSWKRDWLRTSNSYAAGATQQAYATDWMDDEA